MKHFIGVDLGGTSLRVVRIDPEGHILQHQSAATAASAGPDVVIGQIVELIEEVIQNVPRDEIVGIGVGVPGALDPVNGVVLKASNLRGWVDIPLQQVLENRIGLSVIINNDANVAALGEWYLGSGRGCQDFVYVGLGTGIGGGVIANGKLLLGRKGIAGEIGHMQIAIDGPLCSCGQTGCWEAFASGLGLTRFAIHELQSGISSMLQDKLKANSLVAEDIFTAAEKGDEFAMRMVRHEGEMVGRGLINILHLYAPERVAFGGGLSQRLDWLEPHIKRVVNTKAMEPFRDTPITRAQLGEHAGVIGAAALHLNH